VKTKKNLSEEDKDMIVNEISLVIQRIIEDGREKDENKKILWITSKKKRIRYT
jgi:hypothetical protein